MTSHRTFLKSSVSIAASAAFAAPAMACTLQRTVRIHPQTERFGDDEQANALLTRDYRKPYLLPDEV